MRFDVFTIFPEVFDPYLKSSILQRAQENGLVEFHIHNIRDWTTDKHHTTDDEPYGGGGGMVMKAEPIFTAVEGVLGSPPACPVILMTPQGRFFTQSLAREFSQQPRLAFLAGRYEGLDERVRQHLVSDEISIGDYVLTGGELPALVMIDAITRLLPGALGDAEAPMKDFSRIGLTGTSALHPPGRFPRLGGSRNPAVRQSRPDRAVAARTIAAPHLGTPRQSCSRRADLSEEDWDFIHKLQAEMKIPNRDVTCAFVISHPTLLEASMKFNYGKIFLLGFGFFGVSVIWGIYNAFVPDFPGR